MNLNEVIAKRYQMVNKRRRKYVLKYLKLGFTFEDIAKKMELPVESVKALI